MAKLLRVLLERAGSSEVANARTLEQNVAAAEAIALQRSSGRLESRSRFRRPNSGGNPLRENRPRHLLFLDESGTSQPPSDPDKEAWFALAGIGMSPGQALTYTEASDALKRRFFDRTDVTLHEPLMRTHRQDFSFGGDEERQRKFTEALDELVSDSGFVAFAVGIRKWELMAGEEQQDSYLPGGAYEIALQMLLERYIDYLHHEDQDWRGRVTLEAQGSREDAEHQQAFVELHLQGTQWVPDSAFRSYLETGLRFVGKDGSHPTELSDMLARDVFEWVRSDCERDPPRWSIFESKFYRRGDLRSGKYGLKVFPTLGIEDVVEQQRENVRKRLRRP
ncbi:MAG: hypothetical protein OXI41_02140 [Chloroflexota bacterium]|nr:hypothetical protein [Chloroflexota bacterium]MDE2894329.1 hypothetical protein [Chloroflexota bacterium]